MLHFEDAALAGAREAHHLRDGGLMGGALYLSGYELLQGIDEEIDSAELLTTAEEEWFGPPFTEPGEPLPTWAEVLEQRAITTE